jgi:hypothetical protein
VSVSVLVFVSGWRLAGACLVERPAFRACRSPLPAPREPRTDTDTSTLALRSRPKRPNIPNGPSYWTNRKVLAP